MYAYILITTEKGNEQEVYDALQNMSEIAVAHIIFGEWDVLAKVKMDSPEAVGTFILDKVRKIPGVNLTSTLIVAK